MKNNLTKELIEKIKNLKLLILDVDGVLTDGKIYISNDGNMMRAFDVKDGFGIYFIIEKGFKVAIISGSSVQDNIKIRANMLGILDVFVGKMDKLKAYATLKERYDLRDSQIAYIADDLFDIPVLKKVGFACCPNDAVEKVKSICHYVCSNNGGNRAVREIIDLIVKYQNLAGE